MRFRSLFILFMLLLPAVAFAQTCTTTINPADSVVTAVSSASNGDTVCLNSGSYGTETFTSISKGSPGVTVRSTTGQGADMTLVVDDSDWIIFKSITFASATIRNCSTNIQVRDSDFSTSGGLGVNNRLGSDTARCSAGDYPSNILIDGNVFDNVTPTISEGFVDLRDASGHSGFGDWGVTISNNLFTKSDAGANSKGDGVQLTGTVVGITVGTGNIFNALNQVGPTHSDSIQFFCGGDNNTITGNWFRDGAVVLTHHTAVPSNTTMTNNIIDNMQQMQTDQNKGFVFNHNTVHDISGGVFQLKTTTSSPPYDVTARSNISNGTTPGPDLTGSGTKTLTHWLCDDSSACTGVTNTTIDTPVFVGGSNPDDFTTFADWQLDTGSPGENAGHDGSDMGTLFYGPGYGEGGNARRIFLP